MVKDKFPKIDTDLLGQERKTREPKIVLWAGGKPKVAGEPTPAAPASQPPSAAAVYWSTRRKLNPANVLLPVARTWAQSLPPEIVPRALMALYPRIANRIALDWRDPGQFRSYVFELLMDRRGGRRGFPAEVLDDVLKLRDYYDNMWPMGSDQHR